MRDLLLAQTSRLGMVVSLLVPLFAGGCVSTMSSGDGENAPIPRMCGVLLDPGHGGKPEEAAERQGVAYASLSKTDRRGLAEECYGAITADGYMEKTANLAVTRKIGALLEQRGIPTALTRSGDRFLTLEDRVARAQEPQHRDWILVSIHFNRSSRKQQATNLKAKYRNPEGFEIYILPRKGGQSSEGRRASKTYETVNQTRSANRALAESIETELAGVSSLVNRGVKEAWFVVLRGSPLPAVLIEGGFMSNPEEGKRIATEAYQWKLARAIATGILNYRSRVTTVAWNQSSRSTSPDVN